MDSSTSLGRLIALAVFALVLLCLAVCSCHAHQLVDGGVELAAASKPLFTLEELSKPVLSGGCPNGSKLYFKPTGPYSWQLVLDFPPAAAFGWELGSAVSPFERRVCAFSWPVMLSYDQQALSSYSANTLALGSLVYATDALLDDSQSLSASVSYFWSGDSTPAVTSLKESGPLKWSADQPVSDEQNYELRMPASGAQTLLRMNLRLILKTANLNSVLSDTKFLVHQIVLGNWEGMNYSPK